MKGDILLAMSENTTGKIGKIFGEIFKSTSWKVFYERKKYNSFLYNF